MLTIRITNDKTGTDEAANYRYLVSTNLSLLAHGRIEGHNRADGWRALVREMVAPGMLDALRHTREHLQMMVSEKIIEYYDFSEIDIAITQAKGD